MKYYSVYINIKDREHVEWWNKVSKFVNVVDVSIIVNDADEAVAHIYCIKGIFAKKIMMENREKFIGDMNY